MDEDLSFGHWVKVRRVALRLTQAKLAERTGYSTVTIRKIESDDLRPSRQIAEKLAEQLALAPEEWSDFIRWARGEADAENRRPLSAVSGYQSPSKITTHPSTRLPLPPTRLIGRQREVVAVSRLLLHPDVRLVTLTGSGGSGKTRLGLEVAHAIRESFAEGAYFVDLAPITDPGLVASTIADTMGLRETGDWPLLEILRNFLREKHLILFLDNFEQVVAAAPLVADLLAACPHFKVLVTSREPLRVRGEKEYPVEPLALPDHFQDEGDPTEYASRITQYAAVELFVQRASDVKPGFAVTEENGVAVAESCIRLDGLPLAIELAAVRAKMFSPDVILARLMGAGDQAGSSLRLLTGGARCDLPTRQRTLRNTIAWSYDLLSDDEKKLFRRLAVFVGGCTLEAAEAVCTMDGDLNVDMLDGVASLVDKNLVRQGTGAKGQPRLMLPVMIREYALERLMESGEARVNQERHARFYLKIAEETEPQLRGPEQIACLNRLKAELDNLRAAVRWAMEHDAGEVGLRLVGALHWFWIIHGHFREGLQWTTAVLESLDALRTGTVGPSHSARAKALSTAGILAWMLSNLRAPDLLVESVAIWRTVGDQAGLAYALQRLGLVMLSQGEPARARGLAEESVALFRSAGDKPGLALAVHCLGLATLLQGDERAGRVLMEQGVELFREAGDKWGLAIGLRELGRLIARQGNDAVARPLLEESIALWWELDTKVEIAFALVSLAEMEERQGDTVKAASLLQQSLLLFKVFGDEHPIVAILDRLKRVAERQG